MMSTVDICQKILCWLRDGKRLIGYIPRVCVRLFQCKNARMQAWNPLDLIWVDTDKSVDPAYKKIRSKLRAREFEAVKVLVSIMMSVGLSNKGKPMKLTHYDISRAHFHGTAQRLIYIRLPAEDRQKYGEDKVGRLVKSMYGTQDASHIWQLDYVNLICGDVGGFRRGKTEVQHRPQSKSRCENDSPRRRLCVFVGR